MKKEIRYLDKEEIRAKIRKDKLRNWIRDAKRLKDRTPEESLHLMFELIEFSFKLNKASR